MLQKNIPTAPLLLMMLCIFQLVSCHTERNIKEYYFPLDSLTTGVVYEYLPVSNDTLPPVYWYYSTTKNDTATFLVANYYDFTFNNTQLSIEEIVGNGVLMKDYFFMGRTRTGQLLRQQAKVKLRNVFPFEIGENNGFLVSELSFQDNLDSLMQINLLRNRQYMKDTTYVYQGKTLDAVLFFVKETVDYRHLAEGVRSYDAQMVECYAKGLGLVYYKKTIGNIAMEYALKDRFNMAELERRARATTLPQ